MRKLFAAIAILLTIIMLAGCGGDDAADSGQAAGSESAAVAQASGAATLNEDYENALPVAAQLIAGSLKLEDTDLAIDVEEAGKLLPLWQAYQSLSNSDTAAQAEIDALVRQIDSTMTPEQLAAIAAMQLTGDSIPEILQSLGGGGFFGPQGGASGGGAGGDFTPPQGFPGGEPGGFPEGGPGGFPGGPGGGFGEASPERATAIAERMAQNGGAAGFMTRGLVNQLITTLQLKTGDLTQEDLDAQQARRAILRWLPLVAETTGISADTLQEALNGGQTLAEAIQANGGDLAATETALREALQANPGLDEQAIAEQLAAVLNGKAPAAEQQAR